MINVRDCDVFKVLLCPGCGSNEIRETYNTKAGSCCNCHMFFRVLHTDRSNIKIVYASPKSGFTFNNYFWKASFITHSLPPTWRERGAMTDDIDKIKISKCMSERWEAHQVAVALNPRR